MELARVENVDPPPLDALLKAIRSRGADQIAFQYSPDGVWCVVRSMSLDVVGYDLNERDAAEHALTKLGRRRGSHDSV
jgi:hypothetical protein